jgi:F420-non-reducing hydrogenase iron-sulfur subunit
LKETKEAKTEFEPKILAFCCNWCSYAGADLAGVSRFQMPPNLRVIRVMCSGRVPPELVIRALANGLDGVMVLGCHPGECHYSEGNYITRRRAHVLKRLLEYIGLEPERFQLRWVSAAEGAKFAAVVKEAAEKITALGPNRLANGK